MASNHLRLSLRKDTLLTLFSNVVSDYTLIYYHDSERNSIFVDVLHVYVTILVMKIWLTYRCDKNLPLPIYP